jgi:hypothetical protein
MWKHFSDDEEIETEVRKWLGDFSQKTSDGRSINVGGG